MSEKILFKPEFFEQNIRGPADLVRINDLVNMRSSGKSVKSVLSEDVFPSLPRQEVIAGLIDTEQGKQALEMEQLLSKILKPWLETPNLDGTLLPGLTGVELARESGFSAAGVIELINDCDITVIRGDKKYRAECDTIIPPTQEKIVVDSMRRNKIGQLAPCKIKVTKPIKYTIKEINSDFELRFNLKKVIKDSRYESRPPGGGPVQRARFQEQRVTGQIVKQARERAKIVFKPVNQSTTDVKSFEKVNKTKETIDPAVAKVVDWFKRQRSKKWILGDNEKKFVEDLQSFADGQPIDFLTWNCLDFEWQQNSSGGYPSCILYEGDKTSVIKFNALRMREILFQLSSIGKPEIMVLVPSNEALYPEMWTYLQTEEEREKLLDSAVDKLNRQFEIDLPLFPIKAIRWDKYLRSRGITKTAKEYSIEGEIKIRRSPSFPQTREEAVKSGVDYFRKNGIRVKPQLIADKRITYYGVYSGEGIAFSDIKALGRKIVVINLEEFRVSQMELLGADGNLSIATPVPDSEMTKYYQWAERQISNGKKNEKD